MHTVISGMVSALRVSRGEALHEKSFQRPWQEGLKRASPREDSRDLRPCGRQTFRLLIEVKHKSL